MNIDINQLVGSFNLSVVDGFLHLDLALRLSHFQPLELKVERTLLVFVLFITRSFSGGLFCGSSARSRLTRISLGTRLPIELRLTLLRRWSGRTLSHCWNFMTNSFFSG